MKSREMSENPDTIEDSERRCGESSHLMEPRRIRGSFPAIPVYLLLIFCLFSVCHGFEERRCGTLDIRNTPRTRIIHGPPQKSSLDQMYGIHINCTVMEGSFLMSMISNENITEEDFPTFENLREITGSLLIFQVRGLRSLRSIFPNLRVIGGQNLIQHYSLIVYQNKDLVELGLDELRVIRNGGVRIAENQRLCKAKSIDWKRLQYGHINDVLVDDAEEIGMGEGRMAPCDNTCPSLTRPERCLYDHQPSTAVPACWGEGCQLYCEHDRAGGGLAKKGNASSRASVLGPGCADSDWSRCDEECVAGCSRAGDARYCHACAHISHGGRCIKKCPPHLFSYLDRRCITRSQCEDMPVRGLDSNAEHWKAVEGKCHYHCPEKYEEDPDNRRKCRICVGECLRKCPGNETIDTLSKAKLLVGCNVIDGYLEVDMRVGMDSMPAEELTKAFSKIQVIDGYLLIRLSPSIINLNMFKSLRKITGRYVHRAKYALSVYENPNLQKLFPPNSNLTIDAGHVQFHNNPMLCFRHIKELMQLPSLNRESEMNEEDQSSAGNGDKAICDESSFVVSLEKASSTSFTLKWPPYNTTNIDYRKFLGYEVMYKEVSKIDPAMTIDDDRSACYDSWNTVFKEVTTSVTESGKVIADVDSKNSRKDDVDKFLQSSESVIDGDGERENVVSVSIATANIKPNTIYAYYVTTALVRHPGAQNAVSQIGFVRTLFGDPDPPKLTKYEPRGTNEITLEWDPPVRPNGEITHYIISYRPEDINIEKRASRICEKETAGGADISLEMASENGEEPASGSSMFVSTVAPDTCSAKGCCACPNTVKANPDDRRETADFENAVQNLVFVQQENRRRRRKRAIASSPPSGSEKPASTENEDARDSEEDSRITDIVNQVVEIENLNKPMVMNVSGNSVTLTGLKHYTDYFISIVACQNQSAPEHFCSSQKTWKHVITEHIPSADLVDNSTISMEIRNGTFSDMIVRWEPPSDPNGAVLAYRIKVINTAKQSTPIEQCKAVHSSWSASEQGVLFEGLNDGDYRVEVRTISLLGLSAPSSTEELFNVYTPGFWTLKRILIFLFCTIFFLIFAGIVGYYFVKKYYGKKVKEYATQLISANPEYLSQNDVYKADNWEVARDKLEIGDEIGKGTFGKVYRGVGDNVTSVCGVQFGVCAIKTVTDSANSAERLHFLLEAQVMKGFDSSFIVKLYGVVSDGQPTLVVMEMMEKGNLRDYLRSRRPESDENTENLPVPHMNQYFEWAAQIADGMAYLESIRFCHRDLAARNCMVHANDTVKIGDFGMARDLYYHEYYKPTGKRLMPVRWMAPESLKDGRFDMKSDVWSYGIVLYEMLTLGQQPYMGLANDEVLTFIGMSRKILDRPMDCPDFWYDLMTECWKYQPKERPNFYLIVNHLLPFVSTEFKQLSFVFTHPEVVAAAKDEMENEEREEEGLDDERAHAMKSLSMDENEAGMMTRNNNRAMLDEPGWGEGDSLAGDGIEAEHEL